MSKTIPALAASLMFAATPVLAHHVFSADFDWKKPVTLTGTITKVEWTSPHVMVTVDGKTDGANDSGPSGPWTVELGRPTALSGYGWNQSLMKPGQSITVDGWAAKNGTKRVSAKSVRFASGRELFAASSFFDKPAATGGVGTSGSLPTHPLPPDKP